MSFSASPIAHLGEALGPGGGTTSAIDTTGADLIIVSVTSGWTGNHSSVTDSKGNTYTALTPYQDAGGYDPRVRIFYAKNATVGSGHTFTTTSGGGSFASIEVTAWSGSHLTAPFDLENGNSNQSTTTIQAGSITPSEGGELVIAAISFGSGTVSIDGGFTISDQVAFGSMNNYAGGQAYLVQTSAAAANPTWTISTSGNQAATIASFKSAGGGGGGTTVTPGVAALTLSTFAPTVSTPRLATPSVATLTTTAFAPTVSAPRLVTPGLATLTTTTFAPGISTPQLVTPDVGSLVITTYAPSLSASQSVTPGTQSLSITTYAPTIVSPRLVTPDVGSLVITTYAPSASVGNAQTPTPGNASLILTTFAPIVISPQTIVPSTTTITLTGYAPIVSAPRLVTPSLATLTTTAYAPIVSSSRLVTPGVASLIIQTYIPTIVNPKVVVPETLALTLVTYAPALSASPAVAALFTIFVEAPYADLVLEGPTRALRLD